MPFYIDYWYIVLVLPALIIGLIAQLKVSSTFNRYSKITSRRGITAAQVSRRLLDENGLQSISIERVAGNLTDHYDPTADVIRLSESVYDSTSVAAIGVAAHETGHAIQHAEEYTPMRIRSAIIPVTKFGSSVAPILIILGFVFYEPMIPIGIILYSLVAIFQLVTLPVEFNASRRALSTLESDGILESDELDGAKKVLSAAALTYVAALLTSVATILRYVMLYRNRRD